MKTTSRLPNAYFLYAANRKRKVILESKVKIAKYIFAAYFCISLPAAAFSGVHYDHSLTQGHDSHVCFENDAACDCTTTAHAEESLWEHIFESGCIKALYVQILEPEFVALMLSVRADLRPQDITAYLSDISEISPAQFLISPASSRAPPSTFR